MGISKEKDRKGTLVMFQNQKKNLPLLSTYISDVYSSNSEFRSRPKEKQKKGTFVTIQKQKREKKNKKKKKPSSILKKCGCPCLCDFMWWYLV
jgi:hypothetical protein